MRTIITLMLLTGSCYAQDFNRSKHQDHNEMGVKLFFQGNKQKSLENLEMAHDKNPKDSSVLYNISGFHLMEKNYSEALIKIEEALKISPNDSLYLTRKAEVLIGLEKYKKASIVYKKILSEDPSNAMSHSKLGSVYTMLKQWGKAEQSLLTARQLLGDKPVVLSSLAHTYMMQKKYKKAIPLLELTQKNKAEPNREIALGMAYEGLGDKQRALDHYYKARHMGSKNRALDSHIKRVIYPSQKTY